MAQKNRINLEATIQANLPDNTIDFITPEKHREVEQDLKDSNFNLIDDDAFDVNYIPTTSTDWNLPIPTDSGEADDQLASRVRLIENEIGSQNIAYVSTNGSDTFGEFELGNPLKPFLTITAALSAVPSANAKVVVLSGSYVENISIGTRTNFILDIRGCTITGNINTSGSATSNIFIDATGARITSTTSTVTLTMNSLDSGVIGGIWVNSSSGSAIATGQATATNRFFYRCQFLSTGTGKTGAGLYYSYFVSCIFKTTNNADVIDLTANCIFDTCKIQNTVTSNRAIRSGVTPSIFTNCEIAGIVEAGVGNNFTGRFRTCRISATGTGGAVRLVGDYNAFFNNCDIQGSVDSVEIVTNSLGHTAQTQFINCNLFAGSGVIFKEPALYEITGKKIYSVKNIYNKTFTPSTSGEQRIFEFDKNEITDFIIPTSINF